MSLIRDYDGFDIRWGIEHQSLPILGFSIRSMNGYMVL